MSQIGSQKITADGVIGRSGEPVRVFAFLVSSGGTLAAPVAYSGTSNAGTELDKLTCSTVSVVNRFYYPGGLLFPAGCYVDVDANTSYVTAIYKMEP